MKRAVTPVITRENIRRLEREGKIGAGSPLLDLVKSKKTVGAGARDEEHRGQKQFFEWVRTKCADDHPLSDAYAVPNFAGRFGKLNTIRLREEGMKPGQLDIVIPHARGGWNHCYIEAKIKPRTPSPGQRRVIQRLRDANNYVVVVTGKDSGHLANLLWQTANEYLAFGAYRRWGM